MPLWETFLLAPDGCLCGLRRCEPESEESMERTEPVLLDVREGGGGSSGAGGSGGFGSSWGAFLEKERVHREYDGRYAVNASCCDVWVSMHAFRCALSFVSLVFGEVFFWWKCIFT